MTLVSAASTSSIVAIWTWWQNPSSAVFASRREPCTFPYIVDFEPQPAVLRCRGDEDRATQSLRRPAFSRALTSAHDVMVDLSELSFADSSLILDLAALARRLRHSGASLRLCAPQPHIQRLIELVGLDRLPGVVLEPAL
jgi:anti-anti-sigma factor